MKTIVLYQYRARDPITGKRYKTCHLTDDEAQSRHPCAERLEHSRDERTFDPDQIGAYHHTPNIFPLNLDKNTDGTAATNDKNLPAST